MPFPHLLHCLLSQPHSALLRSSLWLADRAASGPVYRWFCTPHRRHRKWTAEHASLFLGHPEEQQWRKASCGQNLQRCIWCSLYSEGKMARCAIINQFMAAVSALISNLRTHSTSCPGAAQTAEGEGEGKCSFHLTVCTGKPAVSAGQDKSPEVGEHRDCFH